MKECVHSIFIGFEGFRQWATSVKKIYDIIVQLILCVYVHTTIIYALSIYDTTYRIALVRVEHMNVVGCTWHIACIESLCVLLPHWLHLHTQH